MWTCCKQGLSGAQLAWRVALCCKFTSVYSLTLGNCTAPWIPAISCELWSASPSPVPAAQVCSTRLGPTSGRGYKSMGKESRGGRWRGGSTSGTSFHKYNQKVGAGYGNKSASFPSGQASAAGLMLAHSLCYGLEHTAAVHHIPNPVPFTPRL